MNYIETIHEVVDRLEVWIEVRMILKMEEACFREELIKNSQSHSYNFILFSCNLARFLFLFLFLFLGLFFIRLFLFWKKKIEFRNAQELKDFCNLYLEEVWKFNVFS